MLVVLSTLIEYNVSRFHKASRGAVYKAEHFVIFSVPEEGAKEGLSAEFVALGCGYMHEGFGAEDTEVGDIWFVSAPGLLWGGVV